MVHFVIFASPDVAKPWIVRISPEPLTELPLESVVAWPKQESVVTVVVMSVPGAVLTPWADEVPAIVTNFMPGQAAGSAIADILFGKVNPSARLPLTFPNTDNDQNMSPAQYPGLPDPEAPLYANYTEGLFVGYRYYDKHGIEPAFAFVK